MHFMKMRIRNRAVNNESMNIQSQQVNSQYINRMGINRQSPNNSNKQYIKTGKVILTKDTTKNQQVNLYNKYYLNIAKKCDWVIVVDLDEFMYSRKGFNTIKDYLNSLNHTVNQIFIPWAKTY